MANRPLPYFTPLFPGSSRIVARSSSRTVPPPPPAPCQPEQTSVTSPRPAPGHPPPVPGYSLSDDATTRAQMRNRLLSRPLIAAFLMQIQRAMREDSVLEYQGVPELIVFAVLHFSHNEWPDTRKHNIDILVLSEGDGAVPEQESKVDIEYTGWLFGGKRFIQHREKMQLGRRLNIKGLEQALTQSKVGSRIKVWIPAELAYGKRGAGALIPPNSDLVLEIKLLALVVPDAPLNIFDIIHRHPLNTELSTDSSDSSWDSD